MANASEARRILSTDDSSALALLIAAKALVGDFYSWEPETLWRELLDKGVDLSEPNRAKVQAAIALLFVPSFYWDAIVLEKTAVAFDGLVPNPDTLQEADPGQLAWAVIEVRQIREHLEQEPLEFAHEPTAYAAVVLHREGFLVAPPELSFCQGLLDRMNDGGADLREQVRAAVSDLREDQSLTETPLDVQLARLLTISKHVKGRSAQQERDLASLA